jgi:3D (Asp-Asp-Asp) domain-containing protein
MPNQLNLEATFYSREETMCHLPATELHGLTLKEVQAGQQSPQCGDPSIARLQCAVDPNIIPLKTNFTLILWDGNQIEATALDTGTAIQGNKIDIFVDTNNEAINLGVKPVTAVLDNGEGNPPGNHTYTVQPRDSLCAIAQKFYGDGSEQSWRKIYDANKAVIGSDPNQLQVGIVLTIR